MSPQCSGRLGVLLPLSCASTASIISSLVNEGWLVGRSILTLEIFRKCPGLFWSSLQFLMFNHFFPKSHTLKYSFFAVFPDFVFFYSSSPLRFACLEILLISLTESQCCKEPPLCMLKTE